MDNEEQWEGFYDWDMSTQVGIGAALVGAPLVLAVVEALGWGEVGFAVAAMVAGGLGVTGKVLIGKYTQRSEENTSPLIQKLKHANWRALFETEQEGEAHPALDGEPGQEEPNETDIFAQQIMSSEVPGVRRITIEQMVSHTTPNSYEVYIGRSLTREKRPAIKVNFYKRHLKLIGASQHGKSSMAAALLDAIIQTHDPDKVIIALLDLENKTSKLFASVPHIAEIVQGERVIELHARSYEEVLERLELICELIDYRYTLSEAELDGLPILIVYLEEFIDLKDYFKQLIDAVPEDQKEQAKRNYIRLVYCMKKIAARGLKVLVQFLMCAQVDYADEDLKEALVNITSGMSFCVRPSAARAAGFYQTDLLARNAKDDAIGQCVVEMPDCKDVILSPDYDLKAQLRHIATKRQQAPISTKRPDENVEIPFSPAEKQDGNGSTGPSPLFPMTPRFPGHGNAGVEQEGTERQAGNVSAETKAMIRRMFDLGYKHAEIAKIVRLDGRKYVLYKQACLDLGIVERGA